MKKIAAIIMLFGIYVLLVFRPFFLEDKILFPSNLLMSAYAPWKYQPVQEYPNGPPNKQFGFDNIRQFFPNRKLLQEELHKGNIPLWNPYIYSGTPFMAAFDTAVWYPLSWIAAALPTVEGWNFLVIIQPILSLLFMYLFLRSLSFERHLSAFGAFIWAFSGWMVVYWQEILVLEHSFLWLPLALYASNRKKYAILVVALVCSVFGGFLQMAMYVYAVVFFWNLLLRNWKAILVIGVSLCIAAIQLIPSIEAYLASPRGTADGAVTFQNYLLPLQHLITFLIPDFWGNPGVYNYFGVNGFYFEKMIYIGIIPLLFAMYAFISERGKIPKFWKICALVGLSMGFALPTSWWPRILSIPVLSNSYPTRIFAVSTFSFCVLATYGLQSFLLKPKRKIFTMVLILLTVGLTVGWIVVGGAWLITNRIADAANWCGRLIGLCTGEVLLSLRPISVLYSTVTLRNLLLPTIFLLSGWVLLVVSRYAMRTVFILSSVVIVISSMYFTQKYISFSDRQFVYPQLSVIAKLNNLGRYDRVWGYGEAYIEKNIPQYYRWFSTDGYGNLSSNRYAELISTIIHNGKLGGPIRRSDTDIYEVSEHETLGSDNPYRLRIMELLGVKYILEVKQDKKKAVTIPEKNISEDLFSVVWQDDTWRIWHYKKAMPRVVFSTEYIVKKHPQDIIDTIYDPNVDIQSTIILEEDPYVSLKTGTGSASITRYDINSVSIHTNSNTPGFVLFTDNYDTGWKATVDGNNAKVYRSDYSFKSVYVPAGTHTVVFQYTPTSVTIGAVLSLIGLFVLFFL